MRRDVTIHGGCHGASERSSHKACETRLEWPATGYQPTDSSVLSSPAKSIRAFTPVFAGLYDPVPAGDFNLGTARKFPQLAQGLLGAPHSRGMTA